MLILRPPARSLVAQPIANNGRSWSFPIRALWSGEEPLREQVSGATTTQGANFSLLRFNTKRTPYGRALTNDVQSDSVNIEFREIKEIVPAASAFTMLAVFKIETLSGVLGALIVSNTSGESANISFNSSGQITAGTIRANTSVTGNTVFAVGQTVAAAYVIRNGQQKLWVNGIEQTGAGTLAVSVFQNRNTLIVNGSGLSASLLVAFGGALSDHELAAITLNPLLTIAPRVIRVPVAAAGGATLPTLSNATFVPGSVTATSFRPRVTATY